ncbi:MAG: ribulose-phosphate 3-epimerase [Bacteroidetes bacterium]|nr:ribulose-phosphate 3-epimerase [Bacteroidota bacterium]MBU2585403.1 ribulose-phosphate 3-epimerase [Bacteroidota bacterium]
MYLLAPSILSADFSDLKKQIRSVEMGKADWIHCDVMDGHFVPNITFGPIVVEAVNRITDLPLDVHLMIVSPDQYIEKFAEAGADYLTVHQEVCIHINSTLKKIKELNVKAGVTINPATPVDTVEHVLSEIDLLLLMSVNPGFGGQKFIEHVLNKIERVRELKEKNNYKFLIEVDGGIGIENVEKCLRAGAEVIVAGASIFKSENPTARTLELKNALSDFKIRKNIKK